MKKEGFFDRWKHKARDMKIQTVSLYFAYRDPRVAWYAKGFAALVVAYAISPIDLIPDFIPVIGFLDDLIIVPLGVTLALRMIPAQVMAECRERALARMSVGKPYLAIVTTLIVGIWLIVLLGAGYFILRVVRK